MIIFKEDFVPSFTSKICWDRFEVVSSSQIEEYNELMTRQVINFNKNLETKRSNKSQLDLLTH